MLLKRTAAFLVSAIAVLPIPAPAKLLGGAGREAISISSSTLPIDGFTRVHDPLQARVVLLDDGKVRAAIAVIDQTSIFADLVSRLQNAIGKDTATDPGNVLVIASHTFSAPHAFESDHLPPGMVMSADDQKRAAAYQSALIDATRKAATEAAASLVPVSAVYSTAVSRVNVNRNRLSAQGWWLGADEKGYADSDVGVLMLEAGGGRPLATLVNYAVQSSVMDHSVGADGGKGVTADLAGATVRRIETIRPGSVALFLTGAAGDQMPAYTARRNVYDAAGNFQTIDISDLGYPLIDLQGERLGDAALSALSGSPNESGNQLRVVHGSVHLTSQDRPSNLQQIKPSRTYHYAAGGPVDAPFVVLSVGDTAIVGVQAELSAATGASIRKKSPFRHTMVVTMVNGAAKYMPDSAAYRDITYEAMNSSFAPGSAELFEAAIEKTLSAMRTAPK